MKKVGILFGAGAEIGYGMPAGGKFALDIFREDSTVAKEKIKKIRSEINKSTTYATEWLPDEFENNKIHAFGERVYETIIKNTVGNNRDKVIKRINNLDIIAGECIAGINHELEINIEEKIKEDLGKEAENIHVKHLLKYSKFFDDGNNLFTNNYFAVMLEYYDKYNNFNDTEKKELGEIIKSIFQLQLGAMSEKISRTIEDNIFEKDELDLDIFDDLGGNLNVNYETAGVKGLELLSNDRDIKASHPILALSYEIIESIYSEVLDYKSLIDSNWHYLYNPMNEWAKFCRISIFLFTVRNYIKKQAENLKEDIQGYYDDLKEADFSLSIVGTTNYNSFIEDRLGENVIFLNGGVDVYYDPYKNAIGSEKELNDVETHFIVPLLFTQSGTKPMTSIDMAKEYVNFYNEMRDSDIMCSVGFGFNYDDEHINGMIRKLIDDDNKKLYIVDIDSSKNDVEKRKLYTKKLKIENSSNIKFITVNKSSRKYNDNLWVDEINKILKTD